MGVMNNWRGEPVAVRRSRGGVLTFENWQDNVLGGPSWPEGLLGQVWSAAWALRGATGRPLAEQIHAALLARPDGLTRSQISGTLKHNQPAGQLDYALRALQTAGRATVTQIATGGRPAQLWTATPAR